MKEDFLHYIWKTKNFDQRELRTTDGRKLFIHSFGFHNHNAGPDFLNARIEVEGVLWAGHVEIHIHSSDWIKHKHQRDAKYHNVVLHVVLKEDVHIMLPNAVDIPCLELHSRIKPKMVSHYQYMSHHQRWISCEAFLPEVSELVKVDAKDKALTDRLEHAAKILMNRLETLNGDLNSLIYERLAWGLGLKVNSYNMEFLAKISPYKYLLKHRDHLFQIESLLFGQSGLILPNSKDNYEQELFSEYSFLKGKFGLEPMKGHQWKFSTLRPPSFPTLRIAQLAMLVHILDRIDRILFEPHTVIEQMKALQLGTYWTTHYRFGKDSKPRKKSIGPSTVDNLSINVIAPLQYMYGLFRKEQKYQEGAFRLLQDISAERNNVTKRWVLLGMSNANAADSQSLIHLKKNQCDAFLCTQCPIGHQIMSRDT